MIGLKALLLSNLDDISTIVGLPVATLDSLQQLAEAMNSDANFLNNIMAATTLNSDATYVNILCDYIIKTFFNYDTIDTSTIKFNLNPDISYVDTSCNSRIRKSLNYDSIIAWYITIIDEIR